MNTTKKLLSLLLASALMLAVLTGCGSSQEETQEEEPSSTEQNTQQESEPSGEEAALSGVVNTDGSTSMADVMAVLQESFKELYPDVTVNYSPTGSGSGIEAVLSGTCDIGLSSRALKAEEEEKGAQAHVVALDGVAIVVNPENPVADLTVEQIAQIFTGEVTNWSALGGADAEIAVLGREAGSGTRSAFEEIVGVEDACAYTNEYGSTGDVIGAVASNPNAIGYASLSSVGESVSAIKVGGVECTEETVKDGSYEIQRPFVMVTKADIPLSAQAEAFLEYAQSSEVAEYIAIAGAVAP